MTTLKTAVYQTIGLTALVKCGTFLDRLEEVVVLVVHILHNKEILRLKHRYSWTTTRTTSTTEKF